MVAIVTVNWLLGIDTFNEAKWWAWLMSPPERLSAWMGALVTALIATAPSWWDRDTTIVFVMTETDTEKYDNRIRAFLVRGD